jgi:hypothetical protein
MSESGLSEERRQFNVRIRELEGRYDALLAMLDALVVTMQQADPQRYDVRDGANWLAAEVQKHRDAR